MNEIVGQLLDRGMAQMTITEAHEKRKVGA